MKRIKYSFLFAFICFFFYNCQNPSKEEFGEKLLYMPQALVGGGGGNNNFNVTLKVSENNDTIIPIGIYRSGLGILSVTTVEFEIAKDTLEKAIASSDDETFKDYRNATILPSNYYTFTNRISLSEKQRENWTPLIINKNKLLRDWNSEIDKYILPIRISNSNGYAINEDLSLTMFVIQK